MSREGEGKKRKEGERGREKIIESEDLEYEARECNKAA